MGEQCSINTNVVITDPAYTRFGNNVRLTGCILFGHDGSVNMLNCAYGLKLDRVGKVDIRDNVFVGHGAIVLPGVTIGPNAIVAAGSVVNHDVPPGSIVAGVPALVVGKLTAWWRVFSTKPRGCRGSTCSTATGKLEILRSEPRLSAPASGIFLVIRLGA